MATVVSSSVRERALILCGGKGKDYDPEESLSEMEALADTAGAEVVGWVTQKLFEINSAFYIGRGKVEEVRRIAGELGADLILVDQDLTPAQVRNLEQALNIRVVDRTELILDIFAKRARTLQAKRQVELAQLQYQLPRLRRMWRHLSRLGGGIGTRGPGETQLEVDLRRARKRISDLTQQLKEIQRRATQTVISRKERDLFTVALVGYTNVGKSTLMNALTKANTFVEDRLFATLDATTRILTLPGRHKVVLTDTIGFLRRLPPHLIASFHATLEEVRMADLLLHVADASHPKMDPQIAVVNQTLYQIGVADTPLLLVLNKWDAVPDDWDRDAILSRYPQALPISALTGQGIDRLQEEILKQYQKQRFISLVVRIPQDQAPILARLYQSATVDSVTYGDQNIVVQLTVDRPTAVKLRKELENKGNGVVSFADVSEDNTT